MSASFRPRRTIPSAANTPTAVHVKTASIINKSDAENILSEFISASEAIATTIPGKSSPDDEIAFLSTGLSNSTTNSAVLSQLRRIQRDLRGLPPMAAEAAPSTSGSTQNKKIKFDEIESDSTEEPKNKKIKFEESEEEEQADETINAAVKEEKEDAEETGIDNEQEEEPVEEETKMSEEEKEEKKSNKEKKHKKEHKDKKDKKAKKKKSKSEEN